MKILYAGDLWEGAISLTVTGLGGGRCKNEE